MNSKLSKWFRWLEVVRSEVRNLVMAKYTFHEIQGMIKANPRLNQYSNLFMTICHVLIYRMLSLALDVRSNVVSRVSQ